MEPLSGVDPETAAFLALSPLFMLAEWRFPARAVARLRNLPLDGFAFLILLPLGTAIQSALYATAAALGIDTAGAPPAPLASLSSPLRIALALLLTDFALYWMHRLMHTGPFWRAHRWHHSIEQLYWFSGFRASFAQLTLNALPQFVIPFVLFRTSAGEAAIGFSISVFFMMFVHSSLPIDLGPLGSVFVSPRYHRLHHSRAPEHRDKNFAGLFPVWDWLFGTRIRVADAAGEIAVGIDERSSVLRMLIGL